MTGWKECTLSNIGTIIGGATPSTKDSSNYENGTIAWITPKDLSTHSGRFISHGERNITDKGLKSCSAQIMPAYTILFTSRAPIGYIAIAQNEVCTNQGFKSVVPNKDTDFMFLYYLLKFNKNNIENLGSGTTFKEVSGSTMQKVPVKVPPLPIQKKIAAVLSSLDDKIELNNKINDNLEQQAQTIFKNWFVDFEPFGGEMPENWRVGKLSDLITVKYGKDHKKLEDGKYPVYGSGGVMRHVGEFLYDKESVLIPRKGTLNNVFYINEPFWSVDTMFYTEMKKKNVAKFVYFFVKSKDLNAMNSGSAVPSMTTEILNAMEAVIPDDKQFEKFNILVSPMFKQIKRCTMENENLSCIRDTLLPKLMSGEIDVDSVQI